MRLTLLPRSAVRAWLAGLLASGSAVASFAAAGGAMATTPDPAAAARARAAPAHVVPDTLAQRLQACTACHGKEGRASNQGYFPRIAGKPAGYLYQQLLNFRDGRRRSAAMSVWVERLSDAYLREMAEHFAALSLPYPPPQAAAATVSTLAHGERLVQRGDATRKLPACVQCHGADMKGKAPAMPGLLGLPRDYLVGQLGAWQTGQRQATAPDCMAQIAKRLRPDDVAALASWLSAQPLGDAASVTSDPATAPAQHLQASAQMSKSPSLSCGSGLQ